MRVDLTPERFRVVAGVVEDFDRRLARSIPPGFQAIPTLVATELILLGWTPTDDGRWALGSRTRLWREAIAEELESYTRHSPTAPGQAPED